MNELIKKMRYADTWHRYYISAILANDNSDVGNEHDFRDWIFRAQNAEILIPIKPPKLGSILSPTPQQFIDYNFEYKRDQLINWILKNNWILPEEFTLNYVNIIDTDDDYYSAELHIANMAQRWFIRNFDKDHSITSKQKIMEYLNKWHSKLSSEAKERITSIVNPDRYKKRWQT